jgi:DNA-directed RNA polymerase specialized sigma24 family protein
MSLTRALPPAQQTAAACCLIDGFTPAEAAELLGATGPAMRQRLKDARESLRHLVEADAEAAAGPFLRAGTSTIPAATAGRKEVR